MRGVIAEDADPRALEAFADMPPGVETVFAGPDLPTVEALRRAFRLALTDRHLMLLLAPSGCLHLCVPSTLATPGIVIVLDMAHARVMDATRVSAGRRPRLRPVTAKPKAAVDAVESLLFRRVIQATGRPQ